MCVCLVRGRPAELYLYRRHEVRLAADRLGFPAAAAAAAASPSAAACYAVLVFVCTSRLGTAD